MSAIHTVRLTNHLYLCMHIGPTGVQQVDEDDVLNGISRYVPHFEVDTCRCSAPGVTYECRSVVLSASALNSVLSKIMKYSQVETSD